MNKIRVKALENYRPFVSLARHFGAVDLTEMLFVMGRKSDASKWKEGRGSGTLAEYLPWIMMREAPPKGSPTKIFSKKTGRFLHALSRLERKFILIFLFDRGVIDIREQFPLNPKATQKIAEEKNLRHPNYKGQNIVMTSDLLVKFLVQGKIEELAFSIKYLSDLTQRIIEKSEIERAYWQSKGIKWFMLTENEIDRTLYSNISRFNKVKEEYIRPSKQLYNLFKKSPPNANQPIGEYLTAIESESKYSIKQLRAWFVSLLATQSIIFKYKTAFSWKMLGAEFQLK